MAGRNAGLLAAAEGARGFRAPRGSANSRTAFDAGSPHERLEGGSGPKDNSPSKGNGKGMRDRALRSRDSAVGAGSKC